MVASFIHQALTGSYSSTTLADTAKMLESLVAER